MADPSSSQPVWYEADPAGIRMRVFDALDGLIFDSSEVGTALAAGEHEWLPGDDESLVTSVILETKAKEQGLPSDAPPAVRSTFDQHLARWRMALPFSEAERSLLSDIDSHRRKEGKSLELMTAEIAATEVEVLSAGLRTVVRGSRLMESWWAWRRELGEYEGQGSLDQAKSALIVLLELLVPPDKRPDFYYDLLGEERP